MPTDARPPLDAQPDGPLECTSNAQCDDGLFCNGVESCISSRCVAGDPPRCDDGIECTVDRCDRMADSCTSTPDPRACPDGTVCDAMAGCIARPCSSDAECDDGLVCNGTDLCIEGLCRAVMPPFCDDGVECTEDRCDEATGGCIATPPDRDGDGFIDAACGGDDCDDSTPAISPAAPEQCDSGLDENCNGSIDCGDPACIARPECSCVPREACGEGRDADCDMLVDCADPDCAMTPACSMPCMPRELGSAVGMSVATGTTTGATNLVTPTCGSSRASEHLYRWTAPSTDTFVFDTMGSRYDTVLALLRTCTGPEIVCNDDSGGVQSRVTAMLRAGETIIIDVDGFGMSAGMYQLNIRTGAAVPEVCNNGVDDDLDGRVDCADTDCATTPACCFPRPESCTNGVDDDCDRIVDCADVDCRASPACCVPTVELCTDGRDQDCDRLVDCSDPDCATAPACCVPAPEMCGNGRDDDCDRLADCADTDCAASPSCCMPTVELCTGGRDEDCDRRIDCADTDCAASPTCCVPAPEMCGNGRDDDCDRLADCADPSCVAAPECCMPSTEICDNGRDDDCDRLVDCADPICEPTPLCCVPAPESCTNGEDDDCDTRVDCADSECVGSPACCVASPEICTDARDQDCDALIDCADPDCATAPSCVPCPDRDIGSRLGLRVTTGTTVGAPNRFTPSCSLAGAAPDRAYSWVAPVTSEYIFDTIGSTFDTVLTLRTSCSGPELPGMCNDDTPGVGQASRLRTTLTAGTRVLIVVDGWGMASGAFVVNITRAFPNEIGLCADALDNDGDLAVDCGDSDCAMDTSCTM